MTPLRQKYKREYSFELLRIARGDLDSARALFKVKTGRLENILYMAQQAIEKALKSVIIFGETPVPHTHDIEVLLTVLGDDRLPPNSERLPLFSQYATVKRYEEGYEEITDVDLKSAIDAAEEILSWANQIMGKQALT